MNEKIDLTKILKDCPKGTKLYSTIHGEVKFNHIEIDSEYPIRVTVLSKQGLYYNILLTKYGTLLNDYPNGECILFPSKDQRDWGKFKAPWLKMLKFNPKTLQPFDRVLARIDDGDAYCWFADFVSTPMIEEYDILPCIMSNKVVKMIIPYNEETKHIIGTLDEAPEYYRYWEN